MTENSEHEPVAGKICRHGHFWYAEVESENPDFPVGSLSIDCDVCLASVPLEARVAKSEPDDGRFVSMLASANIKHKLVPVDEGTRIDIQRPGGKIWTLFYANGKFASIGFLED